MVYSLHALDASRSYIFSSYTGKWTVQQAAELSTAAPTITASLDGRYMSAIKPERVAAAKVGKWRGLEEANNCVCRLMFVAIHTLPGELPFLHVLVESFFFELKSTLCETGACLPLPLQLYSTLNLNAPSAVPGVSKAQLVEDVAAALYASKICSYAQVRAACMKACHSAVCVP